MIIRHHAGVLGLLYITRGSIVPLIVGRLMVILVLSCLVTYLYGRGWYADNHLNAVPFSLFGLALSVFPGFRNNVCYDRWWEARKQWGTLLFLLRNLTRESQALLQRVADCAAVQAACERILNTPPPFAYSLLLHRTAWLFCLLLPFGMVGTLGLFTPLVVLIVAYTFFGLDALSDELQDPFGLSDNSLPLQSMVRTIEIDLLDSLGVRPLPEPLTPVHYVLR